MTPHDKAIGTQKLASAVALILYINKRVTDDDGSQRGGWWRNPKLGSGQWVIFESAVTDETVSELENTLEVDLDVLLSQGAAKSISIEAINQGDGKVESDIAIIQPDGREFREVWKF